MRLQQATAALFLVILSAALARAEMVVQACFSPKDKCASYVLREIEQAQRELLVAVYAFTSGPLADALVRAKRRGVKVQVLLDREFDARAGNSKGQFLEAQKIPVRRLTGLKTDGTENETGLMHQKFAVIDGKNVLTGSYNWTYSAESLNYENLLFFRDAAPLAEEYRKMFLDIWERRS